ncbi:glycosyltransferase family protein [Marimonas sp. MJW-29]|uniref:Glycosyltransferase family protein n=1 Tax=Sulfitobacter sediminis TaxID=3234186 RepID=A0ABV3RRV2_9RHOB
MKVMIVVTHLLGTGHLSRALNLAAAFEASGHSAVVASGGVPPAHLERPKGRFQQLPPVTSNGVDFSRLLHPDGTPATEDTLADREKMLIDLLHREKPDALITELFPFGRRILKAEFLALLDAATHLPAPRIFASIRDILAPPSKPRKAAFAEDVVARFYDAVIVHSDPDITPLDLSWPVSDTLASRLRYSGFVAPPPVAPHPDNPGAGEVLVSAGGGPVGDALYLAARAAARQDAGRRWRLLVGGTDAADRCITLAQGAPDNVIVEPARPDFRQMLHHAAASVSLCGYNTALDLLQSGCPAVLVPFDAGQEVEQGIRADALARQPGFEVLRTTDLSAEALLAAISRATAEPRAPAPPTLFEGAARTVQIVTEIAVEARHG